MKPLGAGIVLAALGAAPLAAQAAPPRLDGRLPPAAVAQVRAVADSAAHEGLPTAPILNKALEGSAKGVATDRILDAVRTVRHQLQGAADALRAAGVAPAPDAVTAGGYAINAGLSGSQLTAVARAGPSSRALAASLRTAGTLAAMGVPSAQAVELVAQWLGSGRSPEDVLSLPGQVQAAMAGGVTPAEAAAGVGHRPPDAGQGHRPSAPPGQAPAQPPAQPPGQPPNQPPQPRGHPRGP